MAAQRNNLFLLLLWIPIGLLSILLFGSLLAKGPGGWIIIVIVGVYVLGIRFSVQKKLKHLLRQEGPEGLVHYYQRLGRRSSLDSAAPLITAAMAQVYVLYGDFGQARVQLEAVNWSKCKPLVAAAEPLILCLLCYFESGNFEAGLELALQARALGQVSSIFPGGSASNNALDAYVEVGEILTRSLSPTTVSSLERKLPKAPLLVKPFIAWSLAIAYTQSGQSEKVAAMRSLLAATAPYCRSLTTLPTLP